MHFFNFLFLLVAVAKAPDPSTPFGGTDNDDNAVYLDWLATSSYSYDHHAWLGSSSNDDEGDDSAHGVSLHWATDNAQI